MAQGRSTEIITMIKWIRTSKLSIKELSLCLMCAIFARQQTTQRASHGILEAVRCLEEKVFFIDNLLVRIHFIIEMIWSTGLAPREWIFFSPGSLIYLFTPPPLSTAVRASPSKTIPSCMSLRTECWTSRLPTPCLDCTDDMSRLGLSHTPD